MYQVLLVDDERAVTDALCRSFDWQSMNLSVAAVAASGNQALEILRSRRIDIVISDIRMVDLDGISLAQELARLYPDIQMILISGFAEFTYAQKALAAGVLAYCLKPLDYKELQGHLHKAIGRLRTTSSRNTFHEVVSALYSKNTKQLQACLSGLGMDAEAYYLSASVSGSAIPFPKNALLSIPLGGACYGYLSRTPLYREDFRDAFQRAKCRGFAYMSDPSAVTEIPSVLTRLHYWAYCFFFDPSVTVISVSQCPDPVEPLQTLEALVKSSNTPALIGYLQELKHSSDVHSLETAWKIYNMFLSSGTYGDFIASDTIYSPEHLVFCYGRFSNMLSAIEKSLRNISSFRPDADISNTTLLSILKYINTHLDDCSLARLAEEMNMTPNYLSHLFKMKMGKTYTTFITEQKIEKAKTLLDTSGYSIYEIASRLGFNDYFYFLKTFKRVTGVTIKQYLEQSGGAE